MSKRILYRILYVPSLIALIGMLAAFAKQPFAIPEPAAFATYNTSDNRMSVAHPSNWRPLQTAANDQMTEVKFEPAKRVSIHFSADFAGSLLADMSKSGSSLGGSITDSLPSGGGSDEEKKAEAPRNKPLEDLHQMQAATLTRTLQGFQDSETQHETLGNIEARVTEFTFQIPGIWGSIEMAGIRATAISTERRLSVIGRCPKDVSAKLLSVFHKMIRGAEIKQGG